MIYYLDFLQELIMRRQSVVSSNLVSIGYDQLNELLEVEFKNGAVYQYFGVPAHVFEGLMNASSHGKYLDQSIKKAGYDYKQVG